MLKGTIRDHVAQKRRPFVRFFVCEQDWSLESPDQPLPDAIASGQEPFLVVCPVCPSTAGDGANEGTEFPAVQTVENR